MTFADVFDLQMGKTPSRDNSSYWGGDNVWVSIADMKDRKFIDSSKETITNVAVKETGIREVLKGTVFMSFKLSIGKVAIAACNLYTNEAIMQFPVRPGFDIRPEYLYYYLRGHKWEGANKAVMGATLNKKKIAQEHISYPDLEKQLRIVEELDLLAGIIDKKNAQLHDLEALAQSIFYEIFGDPISNEKGWPIKYVGEFADVTDYVANGSFATLRENVSYKSEPDYAILVRLADFSNAFDRSKFVYVDKHAYDFLAKSKLFGGEIIMSNVGSVGKSFICPDLGQPMSLAPNSIVIKTPNNIYSYACFQMPSFQLAIKGITSQTALPKFNKTEFKKIKVICPPAEMQAQYEERWKAIQRQRERIDASLRDAQALLDSRMDYYFND